MLLFSRWLTFYIHRMALTWINKSFNLKLETFQWNEISSVGSKSLTSPEQKKTLALSDSPLKRFFASWKRQVLSCLLKDSLWRHCDNWTDITDKNLHQVTKLLGLPKTEDDNLLMFFSCAVFLKKTHCLYFFFNFHLLQELLKWIISFQRTNWVFYGWLFDMALNQRFSILYALSLLQFLLPSALPSDWCCWKVSLKFLIWMLKNSLWVIKK